MNNVVTVRMIDWVKIRKDLDNYKIKIPGDGSITIMFSREIDAMMFRLRYSDAIARCIIIKQEQAELKTQREQAPL